MNIGGRVLGDAELTTRSWDHSDSNITSSHWSVGRASQKTQSVVQIVGGVSPRGAASKRNAFGGSTSFNMPVVLGIRQDKHEWQRMKPAAPCGIRRLDCVLNPPNPPTIFNGTGSSAPGLYRAGQSC